MGMVCVPVWQLVDELCTKRCIENTQLNKPVHGSVQMACSTQICKVRLVILCAPGRFARYFGGDWVVAGVDLRNARGGAEHFQNKK